MIEVRFKKQLPSLSLDVAFEVPARGITAVFGRSGAGKTSIVQAIAGGLKPEAGRIAVGETVFFDDERGINLPVHQRRIGYVFQESRLFPHMTVRGNLEYGWRRAGSDRPLAPDAVIALLGLEALLGRRTHRLSGGERQRVAIGRALLSQPRLLLMDEPLSSLDPPRKSELLPYIERLRDELGLPILYISHAFNEVVRLADHLLVVDHGRIVRSGPLLELASDPELSPLVGRFEAGAVIACEVATHEDAFDLTTLRFVGGTLQVPRIALAPGSQLRVRIRSRDVAVALTEPKGISISNRLAGRITGLIARDGPFVEVFIDVGGNTIKALLTRASVARLDLVAGLDVWALIKTVALDSRSVGSMRRPRDDGEVADGEG
ncbi:MAG: molybdenum ABC transporter ATP-binding protein [Hyphomicrobiaceae bacterium]